VTPDREQLYQPLVADVEERRRLWRSLIQREVLRLALRGDRVRPELLRWAEAGMSNEERQSH
jgi:hypothetical protein